jgi:hypothetical protein
MPIRKEDLDAYGAEYRAARAIVWARARNRCEWCARPHRLWLMRVLDGSGRYLDPDTGEWIYPDAVAALKRKFPLFGIPPPARWSVIAPAPGFEEIVALPSILTTAHLDRNPWHNDPSNLAVLCPRCHLDYDRGQHAATFRAALAALVGQMRLFEEV